MMFLTWLEWHNFQKKFDDQHRLHGAPTKFPCLVKWHIIQDAMKEVYFCPFHLEDVNEFLKNSRPALPAVDSWSGFHW